MPPSTFLQWVHQTYTQQWKGSVDITTVPGVDHAPKTPHWITTMVASGAVVLDKQTGQHVTLDPVTAQAEGRSKKEAEQAAAKAIHDTLVEQGWWDPEAAPAAPSKAPGVSRAVKFITDNVPANVNNPLAFLDISINGSHVGRVVVELFRYKKGSTTELHAPLTAENFLALCRGVDLGGRRLGYAGSPVTRVMHGFLLQAGDVTNRDGSGGAHIHTSHGEQFPDEGLDDQSYRFSHPFRLACANLGVENTNSSQFFITLAPAHQLDGAHTCFGKVLAGYGVIKEVEALCRSPAGRPVDEAPPVPVVIEAAGELSAGQLADQAVQPVSAAGWPLWPEDQEPPPPGRREAAFRLDISEQIKAAGNTAYKQGDAAAALARYQQAARFLSWSSFKVRSPNFDVDLSSEEQHALWDCESLLLGNMAAAQLKLTRYRDALDTCQQLLRRTPSSVKALLRCAQAHAGLGPGEYSTAAGLLQQALQQAQQQQLPTRDIVAELHRLRGLQQQHSSRQRAAFSAAFAAGLLHHPSDDLQPPPALAPGVIEVPDPAAAAAGLRHVAAAPGRLPAGPVGPERVLSDGRPVVVDDAWGTHLLVADEEPDEQNSRAGGGAAAAAAAAAGSEDNDDEEEVREEAGSGGRYNSYGAGLRRRLQQLGMLPAEEAAAAGVGLSEEEEEYAEGGGGSSKWWAADDDTETEEATSSSSEAGKQQQEQHGGAAVLQCNGRSAAEHTSSSGFDPEPSGDAPAAAAAVNGSSRTCEPGTANHHGQQLLAAAAAPAVAAPEGEPSDDGAVGAGAPEGAEELPAEAAAPGMLLSSAAGSSSASGLPSYGDGALRAIPRHVHLGLQQG